MYSTQCNTDMVKTYNCSCNRNMYLWWCRNVYKRLQSFIWRYFYCAFLGFCLGIDSNVQPRVGKFGCIWLEWFARGQGIWLKSQIPTLRSASLPAGITLIGALYLPNLVDCRTTWLYFVWRRRRHHDDEICAVHCNSLLVVVDKVIVVVLKFPNTSP